MIFVARWQGPYPLSEKQKTARQICLLAMV